MIELLTELTKMIRELGPSAGIVVLALTTLMLALFHSERRHNTLFQRRLSYFLLDKKLATYRELAIDYRLIDSESDRLSDRLKELI